MDRADEVTLLVAPRGAGEGAMELVVEWLGEGGGPAVPVAAGEFIRERWAHYLAQAAAEGRSLFDGAVTQLVGVREERMGGTSEGRGGDIGGTPMPRGGGGRRVTLVLAGGRYRDFLVTCLRDRAWFAAHVPGCRVEALGNSALVTRGDRALLGRRSARVSAYAGRLHLIGGVLEVLGTAAFPATRAGIEAHLWMELHEETGLRAGEERRAEWPRVLGLARDEFLHQPELFWQWEVEVELEALLTRMDPAEHSGGVIVERGEMPAELWEELTPVARMAWEQWSRGA